MLNALVSCLGQQPINPADKYVAYSKHIHPFAMKPGFLKAAPPPQNLILMPGLIDPG